VTDLDGYDLHIRSEGRRHVDTLSHARTRLGEVQNRPDGIDMREKEIPTLDPEPQKLSPTRLSKSRLRCWWAFEHVAPLAVRKQLSMINKQAGSRRDRPQRVGSRLLLDILSGETATGVERKRVALPQVPVGVDEEEVEYKDRSMPFRCLC
jgi:hypothetical protein